MRYAADDESSHRLRGHFTTPEGTNDVHGRMAKHGLLGNAGVSSQLDLFSTILVVTSGKKL